MYKIKIRYTFFAEKLHRDFKGMHSGSWLGGRTLHLTSAQMDEDEDQEIRQ